MSPSAPEPVPDPVREPLWQPRLRLLPQPLLSLVLAAVWILVQGKLTAGTIILALLLGWLIPLGTARFWPDYPKIHSYWELFKLFFVLLWDIVVASFVVAGQVLGPTRRLRPHFLTLEMRLETDFAKTLLASLISLSPGSVGSVISADGKRILIHSLHCPDEAAAIARIRKRYEDPLLKVFPCSRR